MNNKLNIIHICSWYPNRLIKYEGNFIFKHIRSISNNTNSVALSVYEDPNLKNKFYEFVENEDEGVKSLIIYHKHCKFQIFKIIFKFYLLFKGFIYLKKKFKKFDLIHAHVFVFAGIFSFLISKFYKIPYVVTEHSTIYQKNRLSILLLFLLRNTAKNSKYILPVSSNLKRVLINKKINGNFKIIFNVVDNNLFFPVTNSMNNKKIKFLHISSFNENKNIEGMLKAVYNLSLIRKDFLLTIAGDGDINNIFKLVEKFKINKEFIEVIGELPEKQIADLMRKNNVFVLFSDYENLPCVLLESQACGLPIISTNVGGIDEIVINSDFGILIEPTDIDALTNAMLYMIENIDNYNQEFISSYASKKYSNETIGNKIMEVYYDL